MDAAGRMLCTTTRTSIEVAGAKVVTLYSMGLGGAIKFPY